MVKQIQVIDTNQVLRMYDKLKSSNAVGTLLRINPNRVREILKEEGVEIIPRSKRKLWN